MDGTVASRASTERRVDSSTTIAELLGLVLGCAVAFSLPQFHLTTHRIDIDGVRMPVWIVYVFVIQELAAKACLALIPVVIVRRGRLGGLPRPAEWLTILGGVVSLHEIVRRPNWLIRFATWYSLGSWTEAPWPTSEALPDGFSLSDAYQLWGRFSLVLLVATAIILRIGWQTLSAWAKTLLLSFAALNSLSVQSCLLIQECGRAARALAESSGLGSGASFAIIDSVSWLVATLPAGILFGVPVIAVAFELRKRAAGEWNWLEWCGLSIGLSALVIENLIGGYALLAHSADLRAMVQFGALLVRITVIGLLSWAIVGCFGRAPALIRMQPEITTMESAN